jgi:uncharacterized protein with LGFP repeats
MVFDSRLSAKEILINSSFQSAAGSVSAFDRSDFYRFEVKGPSGAFASLSGLSADANLTLTNASGQVLSSSARAGLSAEAININLTAGTYYLEVSQGVGATTYKLNLSSNGAFANINENINWLSGDFNGDGFEDVLRQEQGAWVDGVNDVQFFLGTSNGGFQTAVNIANMSWMHGNGVNLIAGDFNGDGKTDLIRQEKGAWVDGNSDVQILTFQNGNFQVATSPLEGAIHRQGDISLQDIGKLDGNRVNLVASDFNADGRTDLLSQNKQASPDFSSTTDFMPSSDFSSTTKVMLSTGGWNFRLGRPINGALTSDNATFVARGSDLMRLETGSRVDGVDDVQFGNFFDVAAFAPPRLLPWNEVPGNQISPLPVSSSWKNTPTANFTLAVEVKPWEDAIAKAYMPNQTALGQLVSNQATNISTMGTTGRFSKYSSGGTIHWSAKTGAVVVTAEMEKIYGQVGGSGTWLGMPTGNQYAWQGGTRQNFEGGYLFQNQSVASAFRPNELPVANNDFTGDGKADILWRNGQTGENLFWQMDGTNLSALASTIAVTDKGFKIVGTADFDRDGQNDVLWHHAKTGEVVIARMNGTNLVEYRTIDTIPDMNWQVAGAADFDKDGRADIVWRNKVTGENLVWKMDNMARQSMLKLDTVADNNWQMVGFGDFNGDRQTDILWRNSATGDDLIWQMDGTTQKGGLWTDKVADKNWMVASTADFNGDGKADILWRNTATGENLLWQMDGHVRRANADVWLTKVADTAWTIAGMKETFSVASELSQTYSANGGANSWLGKAKGEQYGWNGGIRQDFDGGYLFRNAAMTKALRPNEMPFVVTGYAFTDAINRMGGLSVVGDQRDAPHVYGQGLAQNFLKGTEVSLVMQLKGSSTAHVVNGEVLKQYWIAKGPASFLGYAVSDRFEFNGGYRQNFEGGCIVVSAQGTTEVFDNAGKNRSDVLTNVFIQAFNRVGGQSVLGWKANESHAWGDGEVQNFEIDRTNRSVIMHVKGADKAYVVRGELLEKYYRAAGPASFLGYPISDEYTSDGVIMQDFEGGYMTKNEKGIFEIFDYYGKNRSDLFSSDFSWAAPVYGKPREPYVMSLPGSRNSSPTQIQLPVYSKDSNDITPQWLKDVSIRNVLQDHFKAEGRSLLRVEKYGDGYTLYFEEGPGLLIDSRGQIIGGGLGVGTAITIRAAKAAKARLESNPDYQHFVSRLGQGRSVADAGCELFLGDYSGQTVCGDGSDRDAAKGTQVYYVYSPARLEAELAFEQHDKDMNASGGSPLDLFNPKVTAAHWKLANNPYTPPAIRAAMYSLVGIQSYTQNRYPLLAKADSLLRALKNPPPASTSSGGASKSWSGYP